MSNRFNLFSQRIVLLLALIAIALPPYSIGTVQASPVGQDPEPEAPAAPGDHMVMNIDLTPDSPNILRSNQDVSLTFNYITNQAGGVLIFARPFSNGALSPSYAAHPSPTYPTGSGQGSGSFTITSGDVVVDQIRFQIWNTAQTSLLFEAFLPVYYLFTDDDHAITNITLTPDTPDVLALNRDVDFSFDYITRQSGGVRIFGRPFTNGQLTPNYAAHGSGVYSIGGGSGTGFFRITSGQPVVDQIRFQMLNSDQSVLLFEAFLPVYYRYSSSTNIVTDIEFAPDTPNVFKYTDDVNLTFNYSHNLRSGVRIFARPFSGTSLSPDYAAHGSGIYPAGAGNGTGSFSLESGPMIVDKVRIRMVTTDTPAVLLFEAFLPVSLWWAGAGPPPGPDMHVDAIEVTQAIQDLNNSVELVAGKRTYVRVHASTPANVNDVFATLSGRRGFINLTPTLTPGNPGGDITVRVSPDRGQINDSFWFELPSGWTSAGSLTLTARLDPNGAKFDPDASDNLRTVTVNFLETPPLRLRQVNVQYTSGGNTYLESNSHLDSLESWLRRAYPIAALQASRQTFVYPTNGLPNVDTLHGWLALIKLLRMIFDGEDSRVVYYGVVDDGGGFMRGKAAGIPGTIAAGPSGTDNWGWDFDGSYNDWYGGHEIGHTRGRYHAMFCGATDGAAYPYTSGRISPALSGNTAIYGFDITTRAIYSPSWKDVMTYCDNQWVSDFTYEGIRSYLAGVGLLEAAPAMVTATDFLAIVGMADLETFTASLQSVQLISQEGTLPLPDPGDWTIALVGAANNDLATYPFAPDLLTESEESPGAPAVIAEVVPWTPGTTRVEIRYQGQVKATRSASANAPTVNLTAPADGSTIPAGPLQVTWNGSDLDGGALSYTVLITSTHQVDWQALATGITGNSLGLHTDQLPGGAARLRVVASDGFLTGQDTGGIIFLPLHPPEVEISQPVQGVTFFPTQQVSLQGSAYDLEEEGLTDAAFAWSSSIDGDLGTGMLLNTAELTTGSHVITLTVTDSQGLTGQDQVTVVIAEENAVETVNIDLAPVGVAANAVFGSAAFQEPVSIRSSGETEFDWTASENIPWLSLSASAGSTPSDLLLTINPAGLSVGTHVGTISFSSGQAGNSPADLVVTLQVTGETLFLPLLAK